MKIRSQRSRIGRPKKPVDFEKLWDGFVAEVITADPQAIYVDATGQEHLYGTLDELKARLREVFERMSRP